MIGIALLISLLSFTIWKKCCTKPDIQPALPAPSAPPAVNPGVPVKPAVLPTTKSSFPKIGVAKINYDHQFLRGRGLNENQKD